MSNFLTQACHLPLKQSVAIGLIMVLLTPQFARAEWWYCYDLLDALDAFDTFGGLTHTPTLKLYRDGHGRGFIIIHGDKISTDVKRIGEHLT